MWLCNRCTARMLVAAASSSGAEPAHPTTQQRRDRSASSCCGDARVCSAPTPVRFRNSAGVANSTALVPVTARGCHLDPWCQGSPATAQPCAVTASGRFHRHCPRLLVHPPRPPHASGAGTKLLGSVRSTQWLERARQLNLRTVPPSRYPSVSKIRTMVSAESAWIQPSSTACWSTCCELHMH